jgi:hypothetical protein
MRYFVMTLLIVLASCQYELTLKEPDRMNGWSSLKMRSLWNLCFQSHLRLQPQANPNLVAVHCDCVIDNTSQVHHGDSISEMEQDVLAKFFTDTNIACAEKTKGNFLLNGQLPKLMAN